MTQDLSIPQPTPTPPAPGQCLCEWPCANRQPCTLEAWATYEEIDGGRLKLCRIHARVAKIPGSGLRFVSRLPVIRPPEKVHALIRLEIPMEQLPEPKSAAPHDPGVGSIGTRRDWDGEVIYEGRTGGLEETLKTHKDRMLSILEKWRNEDREADQNRHRRRSA